MVRGSGGTHKGFFSAMKPSVWVPLPSWRCGREGSDSIPPSLPMSPFCPRELAECRKTQQEENADESRSRVQLASIEAKHVSRGGWGCSQRLGHERGLPHPIFIPMLCCSWGSRRPAAVQGKSQETVGQSTAFQPSFCSSSCCCGAFVSSRDGCPCSVTSCPSLAAVTPVCAPPAAVPVLPMAACGSGCLPGAGD